MAVDPPANPIFTAVEFSCALDDDVQSMITQPLLGEERFDGLEIIDLDDDSITSDIGIPKRKKDSLPSKALATGFVTGFVIHAIPIAAYASIVMHFGANQPKSHIETSYDWFLWACASILTQIDLLVYVVIFMTFTLTLTGSGLEMIRSRTKKNIQQRYIFILSVYFLVGIIIGAFSAWSVIDFYIGFVLPLVPIAITISFDLALCYIMVWCYDANGATTDLDDRWGDNDSQEGVC
jgi:hypothetical protein